MRDIIATAAAAARALADRGMRTAQPTIRNPTTLACSFRISRITEPRFDGRLPADI